MQGLKPRKMVHADFTRYQQTEDIIFLQECHETEVMRNFLEQTLDPAWKIGAYVERPQSEQGHHTGGTTVMLHRRDIEVTVSHNQGLSKNDDFLWVAVGNTEIGCLYLRPDNRHRGNPDPGRTFRDFEDHIKLRTALPENRVLVIGDHNVRTASLQIEGFTPRMSEDEVTRGRGTSYLNILREGRLGILNGAIGTDKAAGGLTTHQGPKTRTTIDYALASASLLDAHDITDFEVLPYLRHISDHCAIRVTLLTEFTTIANTTTASGPNVPTAPLENRNPVSDPRERPHLHADTLLEELLTASELKEKEEAHEDPTQNIPMDPFERDAHATAFHKSDKHIDNAKTRKNWESLLAKAKDRVASVKTAAAHLKIAASANLAKTKTIAEKWRQRHKREVRRHEFKKAIKSERAFHDVYKRIINGKAPDRLPDNVAQDAHAGHSRHYEGMGITMDPPFHNTAARDAATEEEKQAPKVTFNTSNHPLHRSITRSEVEQALGKTSGRRTASGPDRVSWAKIETMDVDRLTILFQWCLDHNEIPNAWLIAHIVPIAKKTTDPADPSTYRGITLESCLLKLLTTILSERMNQWITHDKNVTILPHNQGGFRPGYRTEANILTLDHILDQARRAGKDVYVAFVDLKKAFDTVSRGLLWQKLRLLGCSGKVFDLIRTLYSGLHSMVRLGSFTGEIFKGEVGVAQGDPLSGILWDIYLHDFRLQEFSDTAKIGTLPISHLLFADDIALISIGGSEAMQARINELTGYCNHNCLTISAPKTVVVKFPFATKDTDAEPVFFLTNGQKIKEIDQATYIGICFERNKPDRFSAHIATLYNKAKFVAFGALALQRVIGGVKLIDSLDFCRERIHSRLLFGSEVTFHAPAPAHDNLILTYLRRSLALPDQCTVAGVYTSTGIYPLEMLKLERAVKFLSYLERADAPVFARAAMLEMRKIIVPPSGKGSRSPTWLSALRAAVSKRGLVLPEAPQGGYATVADSKRASQSFCTALRKQEVASLFSQLERNNSAQLLCSPGRWFGLQTYLTTNSAKDRMIMSRLRFKMDNLCEQVGRRRRKPAIPPEHRICSVCDTGEMESALHMLSDCDGNDTITNLRVALFNAIAAIPECPSTAPTVKAAHTCHMEYSEENMELLWHTLLNTKNPDIALLVTKFASAALTIFMTYERRFMSPADLMAHLASPKIDSESLPPDTNTLTTTTKNQDFAHDLRYDGIADDGDESDDEWDDDEEACNRL
ncbi:hypothetical protein P7C70_g5660, partial [Phenoliferia sp. Uapishka_3]